ncbi:MAG TPA: SGNH/GDSL hydrolase family protein [Puia sp.]|nr:SGNH/GDSL hydrolase family protein [Puia sp.]
MHCLLLLFCCLAMASFSSYAQILGIIGSSTAAGEGASSFDSSWVAITTRYYKGLGELTRTIDSAVSGTTTWDGMPSSFKPPGGLNPAPDTPNPNHNVTKILQLGSDVVIVGYPSNDIAFGFTLTQYLANLRTIYDSVVAAGKVAWITTTQPRDDISPSLRQLALQGRDSILSEFPQRSLNFWDPVVDPSNLGILAKYSFGDGIHLNNAGHAAIALVAENAGIMTPSPLPLTLTSFGASKIGKDILLQWTTAFDGSGGPVVFEVQRSTGNTAFAPIYNSGSKPPAAGTWSWTDSACPAGTLLYRLRWLQGSQENYSKIVSIDNSGTSLNIDKVYQSGASELMAQLDIPAPGNTSLTIHDMAGRLIIRKEYKSLPSKVVLSISLPPMAPGEYVLRVDMPGGGLTAKPFVIF